MRKLLTSSQMLAWLVLFEGNRPIQNRNRSADIVVNPSTVKVTPRRTGRSFVQLGEKHAAIATNLITYQKCVIPPRLPQ